MPFKQQLNKTEGIEKSCTQTKIYKHKFYDCEFANAVKENNIKKSINHFNI